jgi:hypothetical protein
VTKVDNSRSYHFKVRGENDCGLGEFSSILTVNIAFSPDKVKPVATETINCFFKISWTAPDNRGAEITEYNVEI